MVKVAVVTDSNSGITQNEARRLGIHVIPMPFVMDGVSYYEDIDLTQEMFYEKLKSGEDISTSQPMPGSVLAFWDQLLEEYDEIVHIPMSSGLSSAYSTSAMLAEDYDVRVQVVDNQRISVTLRRACMDALTLSNAGWNAVRIKTHLEDVRLESSIYIMVDSLKYLKKGGRITPAGAALGSILNIKPVLQIQGDKLDAYAKSFGTEQARKTMIKAMQDDFSSRFGGRSDPEHMWLDIAYTLDLDAALDFRQEVEAVFRGYDIHVAPLSLSVSCHIGPGALALACSVKLDCL